MGTFPHLHACDFRHLPKNPCRFVPALGRHAMLGLLPLPDGSRTFRCRREGMPLDQVRKRQRASREEAMAIAVPLAVHFPSGMVREPATGPGSVFLPAARGWGAGHRSRACGGHGAFLRQGPCRNLRPKHLPRSVRTAAGATRTEGPEEGQVRKPTSVSCEAAACRMGTPSGEFRAARCQRHPITCLPEALPACGPPDLNCTYTPAALSRGLRLRLSGWTSRQQITARRNPAPVCRYRGGPGS